MNGEKSHSVTIVLPIKDRIPFTMRWLDYARLCMFSGKILIADGGKKNTLAEELRKEKYKNLDIEYLRYPYDETLGCYFKKMSDVLQLVETPYALMADDDDFFLFDGIIDSVDFLNHNPDYVTCRGGLGIVTVAQPVNSDNVYGNAVFSNIRHDNSIEQESAHERLQNQCMTYSLTCYDVHRTEVIQNSYSALYQLDFKDIFLSELLTSYLTVVSGKIKRISGLYLLRQSNPPQSSATAANQRADYFDRLLLDSWSTDINGMIERIANLVCEIDKIDFEMAIDLVRSSYKYKMKATLKKFLLQEDRVNETFFRKAASYVQSMNDSSRLKKIIYGLMRKYRYIKGDERSILNSSKSPYFAEFKLIQNIIRSS
ncbi:TIGR00180 family glycosyltransferase [bacterium]|nr:TIGR00180 family glycosyltransferase [bacterium]